MLWVALDTSMENPPLYTVSGQCCVHSKGHINSSCPHSYHQSNYFLGQHLGLQSTIDLHCNWLHVKRAGASPYSVRSIGYSRDVNQDDVNSNGTFDRRDMDQSVDLSSSLGNHWDV